MDIFINENLKKVIRVVKDSGYTCDNYNKTEVAEISKLSRKYLQRKKIEIQSYWNEATKPTQSDKRYFENRCLEYYIEIAEKMDDKYIYKNILGAIIGFQLRYKYKLLTHLHKNTKIIKTGKDIFDLICLIGSRKDTKKGTPIHSKSKTVINLLSNNKYSFIDELFTRTDGYYAGNVSKKWKLKPLTNELIKHTVDTYFNTLTPVTTHKLCPTNSYTYSSICVRDKGTRFVRYVMVPLNVVKGYCLTSILHILSLTLGYDSSTDSFVVSLEHTSKTDESLGRTYNIFSRLKSEERLALGYIDYDISSALQVISLQLINGSKKDYPILTSYSYNKAFKLSMRSSISTDLGIPISDVKQKLTAFANGAMSGIDKHPRYKQFQKESDKLRREVLAYVAEHEPDLLESAIRQSKKQLPEDIDWFDCTPEDKQNMARAKSSVFFFVWTYYERLIRKAMLKCLPDGIEVHDAVYSKMKVDIKVIEEVVLKETGFRVII